MTTTIRVLGAADAASFHAFRLEGLLESPAAFGASHEDESRLSRDDVAGRISPTDDSWVLGAFDRDSRLVGCVGWYRDRGAKVAHRSHLWGLYVTLDSRRQGIARNLIGEVLARVVRVAGVTQIELMVAAGNEAAAGLYESAGFARIGVQPDALLVDGRYVDEELFVRRVGIASATEVTK